MIKVAAIDDHPLILKAVVDSLAGQPDIQVVGTAEQGSDLQRLAREKKPNVIILDIGMSKGHFEPVSSVRSFTQIFPEIQILILTAYDDELYIKALIDAGARGYVLKDEDRSLQLPEGVRTVYGGLRYYTTTVLEKLLSAPKGEVLTEQELGVLRLAAKGLSNASIAEAQNLSENRVSTIMSNIYEKLEIGGKRVSTCG